MTKHELAQVFQAKGVRPDAYDLEGNLSPEIYAIQQEGDSWSVFYFERGEKVGLRQFISEEEACRHMMRVVLSDRSAIAEKGVERD